MIPRARSGRRGVTLIELLCVLGIIAILLGLLVGPLHKALFKARGLERENNASSVVWEIAERLRRFAQSVNAHPVLTADDFRRLEVFDDRIMQFLRLDYVAFFPFASADPDDKVILRVTVSSKTSQTVRVRDLKFME